MCRHRTVGAELVVIQPGLVFARSFVGSLTKRRIVSQGSYPAAATLTSSPGSAYLEFAAYDTTSIAAHPRGSLGVANAVVSSRWPTT